MLPLFLSLCSWYTRVATYLVQDMLMASSVTRDNGIDKTLGMDHEYLWSSTVG